jgi:hypothetical protein
MTGQSERDPMIIATCGDVAMCGGVLNGIFGKARSIGRNAPVASADFGTILRLIPGLKNLFS